MNSERKKSVPYKIIAIAYTILVIAMLVSVYVMGILPIKYLIALIAASLIVSFPLIYIMLRESEKNVARIIAAVIAVIISIAAAACTYYAINTINFFGKISSKEQTHDFYVVVRDDSKYETISDIKGEDVSIMKDSNKTYEEAQLKLTEKVDVKFNDVESFELLCKELISSKTNVIFLNSAYYDMAIEEVKGFTKENTRILYDVKVNVKSDSKNNKTVNVTEDPFNVYISGIDRSGSISNISRTDVNMVMTVNPKTKTVLMTSIPRDYSVKLAGRGAMDKLTHSGLYGIEETTSTIANLLETDINYYLKVNFTTVTDLVDELGGITVHSDYDFVSRKGKYHFVEGDNFVNGKQALAFARERYAFSGGDNQRVKNQQAVLTGIIDKCTSSSSILKNYSGILAAVEESMQTDMSKKEMTSLVRMQLGDMTDWNIIKQSLTGSGKLTPVYSMPNSNVYVMVPNQKSVDEAKAQIREVMGK